MTPWYLALLILINLGCESNKSLKNNPSTENLIATNLKDTLKFVSGVRSILHDSHGNYWFGSDQEGVCKYDGKSFQYYTPTNGFCGKQVIYIKEDNRGNIWFGTSSGLCMYDGEKFTPHNNGLLSHPINSENFASWTMNETDLWFPGKNQTELIRIDNGIKYTINYPMQIPTKGPAVDYGITGFSKSRNGGLWISHYAGVSYFDGKTIQWINNQTMHFDGQSKYMHVRSILEDSKGRLWIGNNGIGVQLKIKDSILHFSDTYHLFKGEIFRAKSPEGTLMHVFAIEEDSAGHIWFGDRDTGIWRFDGKHLQNFKIEAILNKPHIWQIYEDRTGNLLFATASRGVYKFNGTGFERAF